MAGFRTAMMVDYLCRQRIVVPSLRDTPGRGRARLYSFGDLVLLRAVERLLAMGLPVSRMKGAFRAAQRRFAKMAPESGVGRFLMTDGRRLLLADEPGALVELSGGGGPGFAFVIDIEQARENIVSTLRVRDLAP